MWAEEIRNAGEMANTCNDVLLSSPSRVKVKLDRLKKEKLCNKSKLQWARREHKRLIDKKDVTFNINHDILFPENVEELGQQWFTDKKCHKIMSRAIYFKNPVSMQKLHVFQERKGAGIHPYT